MNDFIYRIDDIGTSTKHFNQHGRKWIIIFGRKIFYFPFANLGFFKRLSLFRGWAKYDELTAGEWKVFLDIFEKNKIVPIVAVTAIWVNTDSTLTPFPEKFPEEAKILKQAFLNNKIIVANHGLTHCVIGKHLPRFWSSNRKFHREFLPELDENIHKEHIIRSQEILENYFQKPIEILVPPGNVWSYKTYLALRGTNIKTVMCGNYMSDSDKKMDDITFRKDDDKVIAFHDRELKLHGSIWLERLIKKNI